MIKFAKIDNEYVLVDDATIEKYKLDYIEVEEEKFEQAKGDYYTENGNLILGTPPNKLYESEIANHKNWFETYYAQHEQKYRRLETLGQLTDDGKDAHTALIELYQEAEIKRKRIQELEHQLG